VRILRKKFFASSPVQHEQIQEETHINLSAATMVAESQNYCNFL